MKKSVIHDQAYEYYSWQELGDDMFSVAKNIIKSGQQFDRVIALAKGGLAFARSLTDYLGIDEVSTIHIQFYTGIGTTNKTPVITQSLPVAIKGEKILVFDDIVDKGDTMTLATDYLKYHGAENITTAVLVEKPWSTFKADFKARSSEAWVIFPNESRETITLLRQIWTKRGDSPDQINKQLIEIGFPEPEVALFSSLE